MEQFLLAAHVLAGILFIGPVAVTTSLFPRFVPRAAGDTVGAERGGVDVARLLHRITRSYGILALVVPLVGLVLAGVQGRLGEIWITIAMVLTAVAGGLLALRIVPAQRDALARPPGVQGVRSMRMLTGVFNLLWAIVVVLMIVRPGAS
ncbi:MAG: hypothetical protein P0Y60_00960 [Candidatus Microbacterium colombiense]|nr:MAG: hypothetical protein P0Y60_00960 [Microbacterium sp.]